MRAGPRLILAATILLTASRVASAQFSLPPLPPVPRPLQPPAAPIDLYSRADHFHAIVPQAQIPVFVSGPFAYAPVYTVGSAATHASSQPTPNPGGIRFETQPGSAQVYVDGYYAGVADDFGVRGRILDLPAGSHRIDLQAAGYLTLSFQVNVASNQIVRYLGDLQRPTPPSLAPPAAPPAASAPPARTSLYVIPKCYAGNRPPAATLPSGCDRRRMRVQDSRR